VACSDFDGQVVRKDPEVARLAEQFVCVRVQSMNGVNINLFQFDRDLTWMAFFMDAQDRFYARYGGREDHSAESHLTKASLVNVMREVLRLHESGSVQSSAYEPKTQPVRTPEASASLRDRVAKSGTHQRCIHCHDIKQTELIDLREAGKFSKEMIFTYPMPSAVGIIIDPDKQNEVRSVKPRSPAEKAGIRQGDVLLTVESQRILTAADFARVLERTPREAVLRVELHRGGKRVDTMLHVSGNWKKTADPSWRSSIYVAGPDAGFWAEELTDAAKRKLGLTSDGLALRVTIFFGEKTAPVKAGLRKNDVVIEVDGKRERLGIRQFHAYCQMNHNYGDKLPMTVLRDGKELKLEMQFPESPAKLD
jgi:predicted metalloprotease with PDZ domain